MKQQDDKLKNFFRLGDCKVFPSLNVIERSDGIQHIEPKAMHVLLLLVEKSQAVILRQELINHVWPGTCSGDESLSRCISLLRTSLGEKHHSGQFIETVSKSGYRLVAPITYPFTDVTSSVQVNKQQTIAVMAFVNMSDDATNEYLSDGISEEILNNLAKVPNLKITSRTSSFAFKEYKLNISEVAKKLGVKNILEGSVRKFDNHIRISAHLIDAETDTNLWSDTFDRELVDLFTIQKEVAALVVNALQVKLGV